MTKRAVRARARAASATLLPLEQVDPSVGPLAFLDLFDRAALETVSRACREEVRAPVLWHRLIIHHESKEAPQVNKVLTWLFANECVSYSSLTSLDLKGCRDLGRVDQGRRGRLRLAHLAQRRELLQPHGRVDQGRRGRLRLA